jgi:D-3-phosphoglycerate dehydrogenase
MHILVSDPLGDSGIAILEQQDGITFDHPGRKMSRDEVMAVIGDADGLIIRSGTTADAELLAAATKLKAIARAGVGVDNIDLAAATERGIVVMNTPSGNTIATAEMTLGLMLALARYIPRAHQALVEGRWERKEWMGTQLNGKTLGLVGLGRVGQAVASRAAAFGMKIVAYDPYLESIPDGATMVDSLEELYAQVDYLSLHAVVTDETRYMINAKAIASMKDGVRIINAARGSLIDTFALADAIKAGKVAGAGLDVYETEPPDENNPLIGLDGVVHTPHLGASTLEAQDAVADEAVRLMIDALLNNSYASVVNYEVLAQISN